MYRTSSHLEIDGTPSDTVHYSTDIDGPFIILRSQSGGISFRMYVSIFTQERRFFVVYCLVGYWLYLLIVECESRAYAVDC